jgi:hypothetical protein
LFKDLRGKQVLLTGGGGQVGKCLARAFFEAGSILAITSRNQFRAEKIAAEIVAGEKKGQVTGLALDLSREQGVRKFLEAIRRQGFKPEVLVHSARSQETLAAQNGFPSWSNWLGELSVDVAGPCLLTQGLAKDLARKGEGSVIFISSVYGHTAVNPTVYEDKTWAAPVHYAVSKSAQIHLAKELAVRLAPEIRVNTVCYGGVNGRMDPEFKRRYKKLCPQKKMLDLRDLPGPTLFLASGLASGITGHTLTADGGWSVW